MARSFPVDELEYDLPQELIAQAPVPDRGASRLLVVERRGEGLADAMFSELPRLVAPGDLLVLNDTRVVPAKFRVRRGTGGRLVGLFLRESALGEWEVLLDGAGRVKIGETLAIEARPTPSQNRRGATPAAATQVKTSESAAIEPDDAQARMQVVGRMTGGRLRVRVSPEQPAVELLERVGQTPLPPYVRRPRQPDPAVAVRDRERYQTVYADRPGAVAAPTAGLHFTPEMLKALAHGGVETTRVTLHVGLGTFAPVKADDLCDHEMHAEWYDLPAEAAWAVGRCRQRRGRVIAVGTTSLRVLETCAGDRGLVTGGTGWTDLFCYPPYDFRVVDALLTNFHLPRSTLLALVMAFAGVERIRRAYRHAVEARYRFFSYGDAMLIA